MRKFNRSFIYERKNSERGMEKFIYGTLQATSFMNISIEGRRFEKENIGFYVSF